MKKLLTIAAMFLLSTMTFAGITSDGLNKNSPKLNALGAAWKSTQSTPSMNTKNDLTIVYGGEDVAPGRPR